MFEPSKIDDIMTKSSMVPESWRDLLEMEEETGTIEYSKFARLDDIYAFSNPEHEGTGLGKVTVVQGDIPMATFTSNVEGQAIGKYIWIQYESNEQLEFNEYNLKAKTLLLAMSRETTDTEGVVNYSIDLYRLHPYVDL